MPARVKMIVKFFFFFLKTCNNMNLKHVTTPKKSRTNAKNLVIACFITSNNVVKSRSNAKNLVIT